MSFTADLMWDEATRDKDAENLELARTAALADADRLLGPLVFQAADETDLTHRMALAEPHLLAISSLRGYPREDLEGDLKRRWELLAEARATQAKKAADSRKATAAQEAVMDQAVAGLAAMAARENPLVPMSECLRLATEAVQKHADAYPLAYESWGGTGDGPITDRAKHWKPPSLPGAAATPPTTAGNADPGMFDDVNRRLDDAENRINSASGPSRPSGPASPTASLDAMTAGFMDRVKNWWNRNDAEQRLGPPVTPVLTHVPDPPSVAPTVHTTPAAPGDSHTDGLMDGFDKHKRHLDEKWDANAAAPGASKEYLDRHDPTHDPSNYTKGLMDVFDQRKSEIGDGTHRQAPADVPGGFSHADTEVGGGQQHLPTDPAATFSHPSTPHAPQKHQDTGVPVPSYFQYGAR